MQPEQTAIVRATWPRLVPMEDEVASLFYRIVFELDPRLRRLFRTHLGGQGES